MAGAKLEPTRWPGIYRRGSRYAYEWTDAAGKRRRGTTDSREQASAIKADKDAKANRGELPDTGGRSRATVAGYALELFDLDRETGLKPARGRYAGRRGATTRRGASLRATPPGRRSRSSTAATWRLMS